MAQTLRRTTLTLSTLLGLAACATVAETGRHQLILFPESVMQTLGAQAYPEATGSYPTITNTPEAAMVDRVARRIAAASGYQADWEVKLLDAPDVVNAFALPGGKIAVYSGILPITQTEDALAAVLGHEVGHVTAHHGNERMSQGLGINLATGAIDVALSNWGKVDASTRDTIMMALGATAQYGVTLPYSRTQEYEADEIGLHYLIRAGYDPQAAPALWDRMTAAFAGKEPPEFMSTHPASEKRAARLRELIPKVLAAEKARAAGGGAR